MLNPQTLFATALLIVTATARADVLFGNPEIDVGGGPRSIAVGDLNGDSQPDFVIGLQTSLAGGSLTVSDEIAVVLNRGDGLPASMTHYTAGDRPRHVVLGDVDGDTDLDIITSNYGDGTLTLLENNGSGSFVDVGGGATVLATGGNPQQVLFVDVVGSALPDIVTADANVHENLGGGSFGPATSIGDGGLLRVAAADLENDMDVDLVFDFGHILRNDGAGGFTKEIFTTEDGLDVELGDLDGDGDPDLLMAIDAGLAVFVNSAGSFGTPIIYSFTSFPGTTTSRPTTIALGDVDGDGDPDVAAGSWLRNTDRVFVFRNDGSGTLTPHRAHRTPRGPYGLAFGDWNNDGLIDLAAACQAAASSGGSLNLLYGDALGNLLGPRLDPLGGVAYGLDVGDVNDDGRPDVVAAMKEVSGVAVLLNGGDSSLPVSGFFEVYPIAPGVFMPGMNDDLELADLDGDDDLDLAVQAQRVYQVAMAENSGGGNYLSSLVGDVSSEYNDTEVADVDGDFEPDIVTASHARPGGVDGEILVFSNDGAGGFPMTGDSTAIGDYAVDLELGDIDGDGDEDAVTAHFQGDIEVRRNDGFGNWSAPALLGVPGSIVVDGLLLVDLDGDDRPEIVAGAGEDATIDGVVPFPDRVFVYANDGSGNYSGPTQTIATGVEPTQLATADFDLDGDSDVAVANRGYSDPELHASGNVTILLNDGAGNLTPEGSFAIGVLDVDIDNGERLQPIDVDRDGDFDLAYPDDDSQDLVILFNRAVGPERLAETIPASSFATTDGEGDGMTVTDPLETLVFSPPGGDIEIVERAISSAAPVGWIYFGQEAVVSAAPATVLDPLAIAFGIDPSRVPLGSTPAGVRVFKDGVILPPCTAAAPEADPDPCFQDFTVEPNGDLTYQIRSSTASVWNFGVQRPLSIDFGITIDSVLGTEVISFELEEWQVELLIESVGDSDDDDFDDIPGFPGGFEVQTFSQNYGAVKLRLRDPQASPFGVTEFLVEEDNNVFPGRLELSPYHDKGSAVATLTAYLELEFVQQQLTLHNGVPIVLTGAISSWPPQQGEWLGALNLQVPLFDEQNAPAGFTLLEATAAQAPAPPPPSGTVPPYVPSVPALGPLALGTLVAFLLAGGALRLRGRPR